MNPPGSHSDMLSYRLANMYNKIQLLTAIAIFIITNIPIELSRKATNKNCQFFILDSPIRLIPISSGNGDAMMTAPTNGNIQAKNGLEKIVPKKEPWNFLNNGKSSSNILSFRMRKII